MNKKSKEIRKVPNLRFPEFNGEWEEKSFKELTKINQGLQIAIPERYTEKVEGGYFYITNEFLKAGNTKKYYIKNPPKSVLCSENDVLMTRTGNTGMVVTGVSGAFHNNFFKIKFNDKSLDKDFLVHFLKSHKIQCLILRLAGTSTIPDLNHSDFYRITIVKPQLFEQKKIASFINLLNSSISTQNKIIQHLESSIKGFSQKLFSQQIRFKDENGKQFPIWKEKKLKEILNYEQPTKYLVSDAEYDESYNTPVLTAGKTFLLGYTNEQYGIFEDKLPTIIFDDFTTAFQYVNFPFKAKSSAMKMLIPKDEKVNLKFIFEAMKTIKFPLAEHKRYWISEYQNEKIPYPCRDEQTKIADFLSSLDAKLEKEKQLLEQYQQQKFFFLQNLFI